MPYGQFRLNRDPPGARVKPSDFQVTPQPCCAFRPQSINCRCAIQRIDSTRMFFLTQVDTERLNIRGSRDPLGLVPLWGSFGRKVVGNLSTSSTSVRGFTTLILGFHFAEQVAPSGRERETVRLSTFLKFEQLAGYARQIRNADNGIRGITEIKRRIEESGGRKIRIGAARSLQILSNQKTYGLWGLYTVAAIESGLLLREGLVLTPAARELVDGQYLSVFRAYGLGKGEPLVALLKRDVAELEPSGKHAKIFDALGKVLSPATRTREREIYHEHLVLGGPTGERIGLQRRFAELVAKLPIDRRFDSDCLALVIEAAKREVGDRLLVDQLQRIRDLESVLVIMGNLFGFLQDRDSAKVHEVVTELTEKWRGRLRHLDPGAINDMKADISGVYGGDAATGERFVRFAEAVRESDFGEAVELTLDHNRFVMNERYRAQPWIQIAGGKFEVRYRERIPTELGEPAALAKAWQSGFYLDSLKLISDELRRAA